jgi:hypothetical protein
MVHFNLCSFNSILYKSLNEKILDHKESCLKNLPTRLLRNMKFPTEEPKFVELKKKEEEERSGMPTPGSTKEMSILTYPLNQGTPSNVISSNFSYSTLKLLEFNDEVITIGNSYYNNSK